MVGAVDAGLLLTEPAPEDEAEVCEQDRVEAGPILPRELEQSGELRRRNRDGDHLAGTRAQGLPSIAFRTREVRWKQTGKAAIEFPPPVGDLFCAIRPEHQPPVPGLDIGPLE